MACIWNKYTNANEIQENFSLTNAIVNVWFISASQTNHAFTVHLLCTCGIFPNGPIIKSFEEDRVYFSYFNFFLAFTHRIVNPFWLNPRLKC